MPGSGRQTGTYDRKPSIVYRVTGCREEEIPKKMLTSGTECAMITVVFKRRRLRKGEMSEWLKEPVLKTGGAQVPVGSNPTLSAIF